jgi:mannose-6-phosphate isomerase class I
VVKLKLNGVAQENVYYYVSANLVEDFSSLTKEQLENAPVFDVPNTTFELGKIKGSTQNEVEFKFTNKGKSELVIRHIRATCGCTAIQQGNQGVGIKPGESSVIKATFSSGGYSGKNTKAIYVYTNDPKKSEVVLMISADVEQPAAAVK